MCQFCEKLEWKEYNVLVRTTSADDNICEILSGDGTSIDCEGCEGCAEENNKFTLTNYTVDGNVYLQLGYVRKIRNASIDSYSESIHINFCPWCGKQISKKATEIGEELYIKAKE